MPSLDPRSIALLTYTREPPDERGAKYATGFFVETARYGRVGVTCAHFFHEHPGPQRERLFVNGYESQLLLDGAADFGVDVSLFTLPSEIAQDPTIHFHRVGRAAAVNRIYYSHGWSPVPAYPNRVMLIKIWGPRLGHPPAQEIPPRRLAHSVWVLRNDVFDQATCRSFSARNFVRGWSGAPVFNVRPRSDEDRVVGVLSVAADEGAGAFAFSVEHIDFLRPADTETKEGWLRRRPATVWRAMRARLLARSVTEPEYEIRYDEEGQKRLYELRFAETTGRVVCPPVPEPFSPYDSVSR